MDQDGRAGERLRARAARPEHQVEVGRLQPRRVEGGACRGDAQFGRGLRGDGMALPDAGKRFELGGGDPGARREPGRVGDGREVGAGGEDLDGARGHAGKLGGGRRAAQCV